MSSSGLIYAGIVGAWAVYLVPVWLRREEQLNEARKKARYAAAIRALGRTERFERRWLSEEALAATGTDGPVRPPSAEPAKPGKAATSGAKPNSGSDAGQGKGAKNTKAAAPASTKKPGGASAARPQTAGSKASTEESGVWRPAPAPTTTVAAQQHRHGVSARIPHPQQRQQAQTQAREVRRRGVLLMRRRRVVAFLFTLATVGAGVSAVLGITYIWAMLIPATLFSVYIFNIRRDERLRAEERFRRRQAALAAERRRERQRQAEAAANAETVQPRPQPQPQRRAPGRAQNPGRGMNQEPPQDFRRAANG